MLIPPIGFGRPIVSGPSEFAPQQELKTLLDTIGQIHNHMSQNRNNPILLNGLHGEFPELVKQIDHFASQLPSSQQDGFNTHLTDLKSQMQKFYQTLTGSGSNDQQHSASVAVVTTLALLHKDLGFPPPKHSFY